MKWLNSWLQDFPTHNAAVATGLFVFLIMGLTITVKLAIGQPFPDGYTPWITAVVAVAGVTTIGGIGKRLTDASYVAAKKTVPAPTNITMEAPSTMEVKTP